MSLFSMRWAYAVAALAMILGTLPADAQSCAKAWPYYYDATYTCDTSNGESSCALSRPVTFSAWGWYSDAPLSCVTVEWDFGDGSPVVSSPGASPVLHTYAQAGTYAVKAKYQTASTTTTSTDTLTITVAHGRLRWSGTTVTEGETASFEVTRTNTTGATSLTWKLLRPDGTVPTDVTPTTGTITLADGVAMGKFDVTAVDDSAYKSQRSYTLAGVSATGGFLPPSDTTLRIADDDQPILDFASTRHEVTEQDGVLTIAVNRVGGDSSVPVSVGYDMYGGPGVIRTWGRLTFAAGELSRTFNVVLQNDTIWSGDRSIDMRLESPSGGARFPDSNWSRHGTIRILEDDAPPTVSVSNVSIVEGDSGTTRATVRLTPSQPISGYVDYRFVAGTARPGEDFTPRTGWVHFYSSTTEVELNVDIRGDTVPEPDEVFKIEFTYASGFPKPPPIFVTIVNDDVGVGPSRMRVFAGDTTAATVDVGAPANAPVVVALSSSDPEAASVPPSVTIPAGEKSVGIPITGVTAHRATEIAVQLPAQYGSRKFTVLVEVDSSARLAFDPAAVKAVPGQKVPLQLRMDPAPAHTLELPLEILDPSVAKVPRTVTIAADGTGSLEIETLKPGFTAVHATLPDTYGRHSAVLDVEVVAAGDRPSLTSVSPGTGPAAGGTPFVALGSQLTADCTLSFGGAPATNLTLGSDGTLAGVTPAHPAGTVDVALVCGTSRSKLPRAFTYVSAPPALTAITPTFGSTKGGTLVRATGANFQSGCWMFFGDDAADAVSVDSTTSLLAQAPPREQAGPVNAAVRCGDAGAFLASAFAYTTAAEPAPSILSVSPLVGAPGESVTITGSRFRTSDRVDFDGTAATLLRTRPDEQVVRIPELPLGLAAITLTDADGRVTTTGPIFTVVEPHPPQVTKVTPPVALPGSEVVLEGRGFRPGYEFAVGGLPATILSLEYDRAVIRLAPATAPGEYPVHVLNSTGKIAAVGAPLRVGNGALRIASVAPSCGSTDGGAALVITGAAFEEGVTVTLNAVTASDVVLVSASELRVTAPPGTDGPSTLVVTNPNGTEVRITGAFRYSSPFDPQGCAPRKRAVRH